MKKKGLMVVVSGFSGTGKGSLMKKILEEYEGYALSVSATTRPPRPGEIDGREYFFLDDRRFEEMIEKEELVEYAGYVGHYYGTPRRFVEEKTDQGIDVFLEIEIQGALQIKKRFPEALLLFVMPPHAEELERRLRGRGTETEEVIRDRLARAYEEAKGIEEYEYILINEDLDTCAREMDAIIRAAHLSPKRNQERIGEIRSQLSGYRQNA